MIKNFIQPKHPSMDFYSTVKKNEVDLDISTKKQSKSCYPQRRGMGKTNYRIICGASAHRCKRRIHMFIYAFKWSERIIFRTDFQKCLSLRSNGIYIKLAAADLIFTEIQHHNLRGEKTLHISTQPPYRFMFYVENCHFRGCKIRQP